MSRETVYVEMFGDDRIILKFHHTKLKFIKEQFGGRFVGPESGGPGLRLPLHMDTCKKIRQQLGGDADFSEELMEWGKRQNDTAISLVELAAQRDTTGLTIVQNEIPEMFSLLRNYQRVGIEFIAQAAHPLIADDPGLGKTWEVIGGVFEAGLANGPNLVVCPKVAIETVWLENLHRFQDHPVFVSPEGKRDRDRLMEEVEMCLDMEQPFWLVVNPAMLTLRKSKAGTYDDLTGETYQTQFPFLMRTQWNVIVVDEAQDTGLANPGTATARALDEMLSRKRIAVSGTPQGGKPERLWGILHWLEPTKFTHKTPWQKKWLDVQKGETRDGKRYSKIGGIKPGLEQDFAKEHAHYILRRTKKEVAPELPDKNPIPLWVSMNEIQRVQYALMDDEAQAILEGVEQETGKVSSPNVLTTYNWLKQFSFGYCEVYERGLKLDQKTGLLIMKYGARAMAKFPNGNYASPKLEALDGEMQARSMFTDETQKILVFSQYKHVVNALEDYYKGRGILVGKITGDVTSRVEREELINSFQSTRPGRLQMMVMSIKAGGTAITLDAADTVAFVDEDWDPDKKTQAEDRAHRISRMHKVDVITIRAKGTIDEEVKETVDNKRDVNEVLLDRYRKRRDGDIGADDE